MQRIDVCNGDADGLCATVQWRWHEPDAQAVLVTGLKREIALLERVQAAPGDEVSVFDLGMDRNQSALRTLLARGVRVRYIDHHATGQVPDHPLLQVHVDQGRDVCTSLIVDRLLGGACRPWALVGAYGDNLRTVADRLAAQCGLEEPDRAALQCLGEAINYNAYGDDPRDVHLPPAALFAILRRYRDPLALVRQEPFVQTLDALRRTDLARAQALGPIWQGRAGRVLALPDEPWARRVIGVLANELAQAAPELAHAVLRPRPHGGWGVSVRAPLARPGGADRLCQAFGGSGRARAAGIDHLPASDLARFVEAFAAEPWGA